MVALKIVSDFNPDLRIAGSDGMDFYAVSDFSKDPARLKLNGLQKEIDTWKAGQREWQSAAPNARAFYLKSNHDQRLSAYLERHPELYDLEALKLPVLLDLAALGIEWEHQKGELANYEMVVDGQLVITHGSIVRKYSAYSAKAELENEGMRMSILTGHTHRAGSYFHTSRGKTVQAHECFCLCQTDPHYMRNPNWQQGIALATITKNSLAVEMIPFYRKGNKTYAQWRDQEYHS